VGFKKVACVEKFDAAREKFCFVVGRFGIAGAKLNLLGSSRQLFPRFT